MKGLLVVLPTYNEILNIEKLSKAIVSLSIGPDLLIIDDSSPDGTGEVADRLSAENPGRIKVIHRPRKSGRGSAATLGCNCAVEEGYQFVLEMDSDFSHDPKDIPRLLEAAREADHVIGSRYINGGGIIGWNWKRRLNSSLANLFAKVVLGTPTKDHTTGFRCYKVSSLRAIPLEKYEATGFVRHTILENIMYRKGMLVKEVPVIFVDRRQGSSKMSWGERFGGLWDILKYRFKK